jgi:hypothetical protein
MLQGEYSWPTAQALAALDADTDKISPDCG